MVCLFYFLLTILVYAMNSKQFLLNEQNDDEAGNNFLARLISECDIFEEDKFNNMSSNEIIEFTHCCLNETKYDVEGFYSLLKMSSIYDLINFYIPEGSIMKKIVKILKEDSENNYVLINNIYEGLIIYKANETGVLDYIFNLVKLSQEKFPVYEYVFTNLSKIFQNEAMNNSLYYLYNNYFDDVLNITKYIIQKNENLVPLFDSVMENLGPYLKEIIGCIYYSIQNYGDKEKITWRFVQFLKDHKDSYESIKKVSKSNGFITLLKTIIKFDNYFYESIKNVLIVRKEFFDLLFDLAEHENILNEMALIVINIENETFIVQMLPEFIGDISKEDKDGYDYIKKLAHLLEFVGEYLFRKESFVKVVVEELQYILKDFLKDSKITSYISEDCIAFFNKTFIANEILDYNFVTYIRKFAFDSPRHKNDFLAYDNCMSLPSETEALHNYENSYKLEPALVITFVDFVKEKVTFRNTTFYEKYYYLESNCLPYGYKNNSDESLCSYEDYNYIMKVFLNIFSHVNESEIESIVLPKSKLNVNATINIIGFSTLIVLLIPFIIKIILVISDFSKMKNKKKNKEIKINKLLDSSKDEKEKDKTKIENKYKDAKIVEKREISKCRKLLNEYFSFIKNTKELFNFNLNNSNFSNLNGITYIKGLIAFSIIFNVFGQTFVILLELQMKEYGIYHFYKTLFSLIYPISFIGYRYSPRILFSCSGYTLIYKYLCYIEQEGGYYFLKFVFLQSYKYFFLYLILIVFRFFIHYIVFFIKQTKRPLWMLFDYYLGKEKDFISKTFLPFFVESGKKKKQNLINFFYMPINETFFFIIGTALISLGFKYRWRLDLIIIGAIIIFFISKIVLYLVYLHPEEKMYTSVDFYTIGYGSVIINPIFNLIYFFIGMYFGLINYSIQKGITKIYKDNDDLKKIIHLKLANLHDNESEKNELCINNNDEDKNTNENNLLTNYGKKEIIKSNNDINENSNENIEKMIANSDNNNEKKEYIEQIKIMPFLISPTRFLMLNKKNKDKICFNILITISIILIIFFFSSYNIFAFFNSSLNLDDDTNKDYISGLSLEKTITNRGLNAIYLFDIEIFVFLSQWFIFILFFKESTFIRNIFNHIYWSFFVKSYFAYILLSTPIIIIVFHESESVIKVTEYNIILFSLINIVIILIAIIVFYACYELPVKKMFKYFLKGDEIIEEENDDEAEEEREEEEIEEEYFEENENNEDEIKSLKSNENNSLII